MSRTLTLYASTPATEHRGIFNAQFEPCTMLKSWNTIEIIWQWLDREWNLTVLNDTYFVQRLAHQERNMHVELEGRHLGNSQSVLPRQYLRHMMLPSDTLNINKRIICIHFKKAQSKVSETCTWVRWKLIFCSIRTAVFCIGGSRSRKCNATIKAILTLTFYLPLLIKNSNLVYSLNLFIVLDVFCELTDYRCINSAVSYILKIHQ